MHYHRPLEVVTDYEQQLARGGLLVRVTPPALNLYDEVELELTFREHRVTLAGTVVQLLPEVGVAVAVAADALRSIDGMMEAARAAGDATEEPAQHGLRSAAERVARPPAAEQEPSDLYARYKEATTAEKIQMALHGGKDARSLVLRDINKSLHQHVLRNPHLGLDEVAAIAKMTTTTSDLLASICERREWSQRPEIALALVRNPKTPVPAALRVLEHVSQAELRRLAKDTSARPPLRHAAAKRIVG